MEDTNLAQAVKATHDSSSYDTNVKFLLADKQILSRILKYAVQEFKDISMLEKLLSQTSAGEKKRILTEEYGMIMTTELEGRIQTMCNLSENIKGQSIKTERLNAIERMIKADATKEQIISFGYTEEDFAEAESLLCTNA
ncbi:hypothetical protein [Parablautia muri]|nr:hypothetical protein [Parablautia muri]